MNKSLLLGLISTLLLPLVIAGCSTAKGVSNNAAKSPTVEISLDDLAAQNNILKYVEMSYPGTLTVRLGSNASTGFSWAVTQIEYPGVMKQVSNKYEEPTTKLAGAGGIELWTFSAADTGLAIIRMSYGQPWEGGTKDAYTVSINVNVK
jgi:inhibitor of cysteine peptidase